MITPVEVLVGVTFKFAPPEKHGRPRANVHLAAAWGCVYREALLRYTKSLSHKVFLSIVYVHSKSLSN